MSRGSLSLGCFFTGRRRGRRGRGRAPRAFVRGRKLCRGPNAAIRNLGLFARDHNSLSYPCHDRQRLRKGGIIYVFPREFSIGGTSPLSCCLPSRGSRTNGVYRLPRKFLSSPTMSHAARRATRGSTVGRGSSKPCVRGLSQVVFVGTPKGDHVGRPYPYRAKGRHCSNRVRVYVQVFVVSSNFRCRGGSSRGRSCHSRSTVSHSLGTGSLGKSQRVVRGRVWSKGPG